MIKWRELIFGPSAADKAALSSPQGGISPKVLAATWNGPGRIRFLEALEKAGKIPAGTADAARAGASPVEIGKLVNAGGGPLAAAGVEIADEAGVTLGKHAAARVVLDANEYPLVAAQLRKQGVAFDHVAGAGPAHLIDDADQLAAFAKAAPEAAAVGAVADDAAIGVAKSQQFLLEVLTQLSGADDVTRLGILGDAAKSLGAAAGEVDEANLLRTLLEADPDKAIGSIEAAIARAAAPLADAAGAAKAAPAIANAVDGALPFVDDAAKAMPEVMEAAIAVSRHPKLPFSEAIKYVLRAL